MNSSWADGGYEDRDPGPSRAARTTLTVLVLLVTALSAVVYLKFGLDQSRDECYRDAPRGTSVDEITTGLRWLPPGYDCSYDS
ncbi:hypothetical protein [Sanguibacter antarcticus]|uniref:Uncharacterized protein n=1 Tax=Sanguibacter antarcticus TaxID=372484 RepID=A0A2A9E3L4_9MICO|nr:hypothetical protein [Sanguibacter antarcticus]PFG33424.1 hypothetical protein ATL42_1300 [Sanguibacter antarcticus]